MVFLGYLSLAAAFLASTGVAAPTTKNLTNTPESTTKRYTVNQKANSQFVKNGTLALAKVYAKYNKQMPDQLKAAAASGEGSVSASPEQYDSEYLIPVTIGGQDLNLDLDTGSADLWVFSTELSSSDTSGHSAYDPSESSSYEELSGYSWDISYGDGSGASGTVGTDTVDVGGVTVTQQAVEMATQVSSQFVSDTDSDGLLGAAFSSINTVSPKSQKTFMDNALSSLDAGVFTVDLKAGEPGSYDFGFIDDSKYSGDLVYTSVDSSQGFWEFTSTVSGTSVDGIADTGTSLLLLDDSLVSSYWSNAGGSYDSSAGGYTFSCSDADSLPDLTFTVEGTDLTISGTNFNYSPADDSGSTCYGGLQSNEGVGMSIFGDVMYKSIFVVHDLDNVQLGFAQK